MQSADLVFKLNGKTAKIVADSLAPEIQREIPRTKTQIYQKGDEVHLKISAEDTNALRAALNSYIRWAKVAIESTNLVGLKPNKQNRMVK